MSTVRHFVNDLDLSREEQAAVLARAAEMKGKPETYRTALSGKVLGMIFTKSSTRTRVSFESGIIQLGGQGIFLSSDASQLGRGEPMSDTGQVLSRYVDLLMIRTFRHNDVRELAASSSVPVINGLDDVYHPCQILADLQTVQAAFGADLKGRTLVYVGDGNNVCHSLMLGCALAGMNTRWVGPAGSEPNARIVDRARAVADAADASVELSNDMSAAEGADVVYTDVWASMGQEEEAAARRAAFAGYGVTTDVMKRAAADAIFLHCLPVHRGEEVDAAVIDGPRSRVFDQAENRLHAQKALMTFLVNG